MSPERAQRKLAAILSADVKDYSRLMEQDELGTVTAVKECRALFAGRVHEYRGRVVDSPGDNILAEFISVVDAVECALKIQNELHGRNVHLPENRRMEFRIGINLGDVIEDGERIYGDGVNIAARVESMAEAGGICLSGTAYDHVENKLPLACDYLGEHQVKNISKPIRVYAVRGAALKVSRRPIAKARKKYWRMAAAVLVIALVVISHLTGLNKKLAPPPREDLAIAVLPFVDMSPDKDQEYFADGLAEELLNALSQIPELRVVGRTSCFQFKGKNEDLRTIGRKLNASTILEGSVRKEGGRMRITAQLINAADGFHLWSETYNPTDDDLFAVQDQISRSVAGALRLSLIGEKELGFQTNNTEAHRAYLLGQYYLAKSTEEEMEKGLEFYQQAIKLDPNYAQAWVGLAVTRVRQADWGQIPVGQGYEEAREAAQKALTINPKLAIAHSILGNIKLVYDWDWRGADSSLRRSLELEPGNANVLNIAAGLFGIQGQLEEAVAMGRRAAQLDPLNLSVQVNLGCYAYYAGHLEEGAAALQKALELNPIGPAIYMNLGLIRLAERRLPEALVEIEQESDPGFGLFGQALIYHALGRKADADSALAELTADYQFDSAFQIAQVFAYRGEIDLAFTWLERAYTQRDSGLPFVKVDPVMNNLRGDPRYASFMEKMGLEP